MSVLNVYNKYTNITKFPLNIITYLLNNNEVIWKLLKYDTPDALNKPNLTKSEKRSLIFAGQTNSSGGIDEMPYRVFTKSLPRGEEKKIQTQLRVFLLGLIPLNHVVGQVNMNIQIISHTDLLTLDTYENRNEIILQQLLETLNGKNIGGISNLSFNREANGYSNEAFWESGDWYEGYSLRMSCKVSDEKSKN